MNNNSENKQIKFFLNDLIKTKCFINERRTNELKKA